MTIDKSLAPIRTRYDDAAAIVPKHLADGLQQLDSRSRKLKSGTEPEIVFKSAEETTPIEQPAEKSEAEMNEEFLLDTLEVLKAFKDTDDPMLQTSVITLKQVHKALLAPGNEKAEILARAANLIRSIRDYAHTLVEQPSPLPPTPAVPGSQPENAPEPPPGQVTDQTMLQDPNAAEAAADELTGEEGAQLTEEQNVPEDELQEEEDVEAEAEAATTGESDEEQEMDAEAEAVADEVEASADAVVEGEEEAAAPDEQQPPTDPEAEAAHTEEKLAPPLPEPPVEEVPEEEEDLPFGKKKVKVSKPPPFMKKKSIAVGNRVTERAQPIPAVKSAAKHPAEVFVDGYARTIAAVLSDPVLTRVQKRQKVEKAIQHFANRVDEVIEGTTPVTEQDLQEVVAAEVRKALAQNNAQSREQMTTLQQTMEEMQRQLVQAEIAKSLGDLQTPRVQRRSFTPAPQQQSQSQLPQASVTAGHLASSGPEVKGMSARDAARLSLNTQTPVY
jgi:hypothetical protein